MGKGGGLGEFAPSYQSPDPGRLTWPIRSEVSEQNLDSDVSIQCSFFPPSIFFGLATFGQSSHLFTIIIMQPIFTKYQKPSRSWKYKNKEPFLPTSAHSLQRTDLFTMIMQSHTVTTLMMMYTGHSGTRRRDS